jgi:hypothetical protein
MAPGVAAVIQQIGIQRATAETPKEMSLDAGAINPEREKTKKV